MNPSTNIKGASIAASLIAIVGTAGAQSFASATAGNSWGFSIGAGSTNLGITDNGDFTYSLGAPYYLQAGNYPDGSSSTTDNTTSWTQSGNSGSGFQGTNSTASSGVSGQGWGTLGDQENLELTNLDSTNTMTIDVNSFIGLASSVSGSGAPYYSGAESYAGISWSLDGTGGTYWETNYADTNTSYASGSGDYGYLFSVGGMNYYSLPTEFFVLNPGDTLYLDPYASTDVVATPTPSSALSLGFGLAGLALLRRRSKKR